MSVGEDETEVSRDRTEQITVTVGAVLVATDGLGSDRFVEYFSQASPEAIEVAIEYIDEKLDELVEEPAMNKSMIMELSYKRVVLNSL